MEKTVEILKELGVTDPEQIARILKDTHAYREEAMKNLEMIGADIEGWADKQTEELPADPPIPENLLCKWEGLALKQPARTAGDVYTLVNEYGMETGVTAVIKRIGGKLCVYITDQRGEVDHVGVVSYRDVPIEVSVHRFAPDSCPQEKLKV